MLTGEWDARNFSLAVARDGARGLDFWNREPEMRSSVPAQMKYIRGALEGTSDRRSFSGNRAALMAGRRLADGAEVDKLVLAEAARFVALQHRTEADSERMRAVLVPYVAAAVTP